MHWEFSPRIPADGVNVEAALEVDRLLIYRQPDDKAALASPISCPAGRQR